MTDVPIDLDLELLLESTIEPVLQSQEDSVLGNVRLWYKIPRTVHDENAPVGERSFADRENMPLNLLNESESSFIKILRNVNRIYYYAMMMLQEGFMDARERPARYMLDIEKETLNVLMEDKRMREQDPSHPLTIETLNRVLRPYRIEVAPTRLAVYSAYRPDPQPNISMEDRLFALTEYGKRELDDEFPELQRIYMGKADALRHYQRVNANELSEEEARVWKMILVRDENGTPVTDEKGQVDVRVYKEVIETFKQTYDRKLAALVETRRLFYDQGFEPRTEKDQSTMNKIRSFYDRLRQGPYYVWVSSLYAKNIEKYARALMETVNKTFVSFNEAFKPINAAAQAKINEVKAENDQLQQQNRALAEERERLQREKEEAAALIDVRARKLFTRLLQANGGNIDEARVEAEDWGLPITQFDRFADELPQQ